MASKKTSNSERPVVVTTAHRGVFVGYTFEPSNEVKEIEILRARMVLYFAPETRGVLGIASRGVAPGSRVTPAVAKLGLQNVTAVMDASDQAVKAWEAEPWS